MFDTYKNISAKIRVGIVNPKTVHNQEEFKKVTVLFITGRYRFALIYHLYQTLLQFYRE